MKPEDRSQNPEVRIQNEQKEISATKPTSQAAIAVILLTTGYWLLTTGPGWGQGPLTPPGPPAPTFKTLEQVEPRTPITNLPYTIFQSGSYYLTTNLTGVAGNNGIVINADNVTLDLGGFALIGVPGSLNGIHGQFRTNNVIRNGMVRNWGVEGIAINNTAGSLIQGVLAANNGSRGIFGGQSCVITECVALRNSTAGILTGDNGLISRCVAVSNGVGFAASAGVISECVANGNTLHGFEVISGATIHHCIARGNGQTGIKSFNHCTIVDCTSASNHDHGIIGGNHSTVSGCTATENDDDGIQVGSGSRVADNTSNNNGVASSEGAGIRATSEGNRIDGNHVSGNDKGIVCNPAVNNLVIRNSAKGNPVANYDIAGGNPNGEILSLFTGATITNVSPWANFSY
jgi:parallel beta-helix repeat protein